jgi:peptide chain release factor subunit 1
LLVSVDQVARIIERDGSQPEVFEQISAVRPDVKDLHDGATATRVICDRDGWLALSSDTCLLDGAPTRRTSDVINELVEAVIDEGGSIEHVRADTALKDHLVGASLRFPLPPTPST